MRMSAKQEHAGLLATEERLDLAEALKRAGVQSSIWSAYRWVIKGVRGVRLEAYREGGRWRTSQEAVLRFLADSTEAALQGRANPRRSSRNPVERQVTKSALDAIYPKTGRKN